MRILWFLAGGVLSALSGAWALTKAILDTYGRADAARQLANADGVATHAVAWLLQTPAWMPAVLAAAIVVAWLAGGWWLFLRRPVQPAPSNAGRVPTGCGILFASDGQPTAVGVRNIRRWFALQNLLIAVNKETGAEERRGLTNLFITFEEPVAIKQIHVRGQGAPVPRWEMKDRDPWQIILSFNGLLSNVLLEVEVET